MGQKKKPLPDRVLERIHELRTDFGRSERKAVEEACSQFERDLGGGKPFSRVRNAYREFKRRAGDRPLLELKIQRATREIQEKERAELELMRQMLADLEEQAPAILGTDDLSPATLNEFIATWSRRQIQELRRILERATSDIPEAYRQKYGHLPSSEDIAELVRSVEEAKKKASAAGDIIVLREQIAESEQEKSAG